MPTTIYDSSLITQRRRAKAVSGSFIGRIQNYTDPTTGSAPLLGISEQSIINTVINGQTTDYRKNDGGCTIISPGCPCNLAAITAAALAAPGVVTNIQYSYGSIIVTWSAPGNATGLTSYNVYLLPVQNNGLAFTVYTGYFNDNVNWFNAATPIAAPNNGTANDFSSIANATTGVTLPVAPYSIEWTGYFLATETGTYTFRTTSDDASFLWIGNVATSGFTTANALIDNGGAHGPQSVSQTIGLTAGNYYPIRVQYGEAGGGAALSVDIILPSGGGYINPGDYLYTNAPLIGSTYDTTYTFGTGLLTPSANYYIAVGAVNPTINGNLTFYTDGVTNPTPINAAYAPPVMTVSSSTFDTCTITYSFPTGPVGVGFTVTGATATLPAGWTIASANNTQIVLNKTGANPAAIPAPGAQFSLTGAGGVFTYPSSYVTGIQTIGTTGWSSLIQTILDTGNNTSATDTSGNVYVVGTQNAQLTIKDFTSIGGGSITTTSAGTLTNTGTNQFIIKYNSQGVAQRKTKLSDSSSITIYGITTDTAGNVYVCGGNLGVLSLFNGVAANAADPTVYNTLPVASSFGGFVIKYNSNLVPQWVTTIDSTGSDQANKIAIDSSGSIYVVGYYGNTININNAVNTTGTGLVISPTLYGTMALVSAAFDGFVIKYNTSGAVQWANRISGAAWQVGTNITVDDSDSLIVAGYYQTNGASFYNSATVAAGTIVPTLYGTLSAIPGSPNFIVKYDSAGVVNWVSRISGNSTSIIYDITTDSSNNIYVAGYYTAALSFTNGGTATGGGAITETVYGTLSLPAADTGILLKYNSSGAIQWINIVSMPSTQVFIINIACDSSDNVYISGQVFGGGNLVLYNSSTNYSVLGANVQPVEFCYLRLVSPGTDVFVVKYNTDGTLVWVNKLDGSNSQGTNDLLIDSNDILTLTGRTVSNMTIYNAADVSAYQVVSPTVYATLPATGTNLYIVRRNTSGDGY